MTAKSLSNDVIKTHLRIYGIDPSPYLSESIRTYVDLLLRWNQKMALTTVVDPLEILRFHFGESMFAVNEVPIRHGRLADVGTGAGFPSIPIRMVTPGLDCVLIESNQKKATFLAEVVRTLGLQEVEVFRGRMEAIRDSNQTFDFSVCRALGLHDEFLSWSSKHLAPAGKVVYWIGDGDAAKISRSGHWNWQPEIRIPNSKSRVLLIGAKSEQFP